MKTFVLVLMAILVFFSVALSNTLADSSNTGLVTMGSIADISVPAVRNISISCGKGEAIFNFETGKMKYTEGCTPDAAAKVFFHALEDYFQGWCEKKCGKR